MSTGSNLLLHECHFPSFPLGGEECKERASLARAPLRAEVRRSRVDGRRLLLLSAVGDPDGAAEA